MGVERELKLGLMFLEAGHRRVRGSGNIGIVVALIMFGCGGAWRHLGVSGKWMYEEILGRV